MADILFQCPACKTSLSVDEAWANQLVECSTCKQTIEVPLRSQQPQQPPPIPSVQPPVNQNLRPCPACQRQVSVQAHSCPACGQPLQVAQRAAANENLIGKIIIVVLVVIGAAWLLITTLNRLDREKQASDSISRQLQNADSHH
jgi:predicted Zn finger-like uncharacterized protein